MNKILSVMTIFGASTLAFSALAASHSGAAPTRTSREGNPASAPMMPDNARATSVAPAASAPPAREGGIVPAAKGAMSDGASAPPRRDSREGTLPSK